MSRIINNYGHSIYVEIMGDQTVNNIGHQTVNLGNGEVKNSNTETEHCRTDGGNTRDTPDDDMGDGGTEPTGRLTAKPQLAPEDLRIKAALETMRGEGTFRHAYDYTWVLLLFKKPEEYCLPRRFNSINAFVAYLRNDLGLDKIPCPSSLSRKISMTSLKYPQWSFDDKPNGNEELRRKNIAGRFLSLYRKG